MGSEMCIRDRCGSPSMLKDLVAILESKGFIEARNINPGHFVIERAVVES